VTWEEWAKLVLQSNLLTAIVVGWIAPPIRSALRARDTLIALRELIDQAIGEIDRSSSRANESGALAQLRKVSVLLPTSLVQSRINHHLLHSPRLRTIIMVVSGGDYVHFVVECSGKLEKCRVTEAALLNREHASRKDAGYTQLITIFVRHRAEIERLALAKLLREGHSSRGVVVTTEDLNP
jgi:Protein of unknown function (DUF1488)